MPLMPSKFSNPWPFHVVAQKLHPINRPDYTAYIEALDALDPAESILKAFLGEPPDAPTAAAYRAMHKHVKQHWLADGDGSFWPNIPNKSQILRQGFLELLRTIERQPRPMTLLWLCDHQKEDMQSIQMAICEEATHITSIILTPFVNYGAIPAQETISEHIWVVSNEADADAIVDQSRAQGLAQPLKHTETCREVANGVWVTEVHTVPPT